MMRHRYYDEKDYGKAFDMAIIKRLFQFMWPYAKYFVFAALFLIIAAGVEILYPYVTKVAIDDYIVKNGRMLTGIAKHEGFYQVDDTTYFATQKMLEKIGAGQLRSWELAGNLSGERYYYIEKENIDGAIQNIIDAYPMFFETYDRIVVIKYAQLGELATHDVVRIRRSDINGLVRVVLVFLAIMMVGAIANYLQIFLSQYAGQLFMHRIRTSIFRKLQKLHLAFFDQNPVGRLVTRATNDVEAINEAFTQIFANLLRDLLLLIGIVTIMLTVNLRLALISFAVVPPLIFITFYFRVRARKIFREVRKKLAKLNARLQENLSGIRVIKIFSKEKDNLNEFDGENKHYLDANLKHVILMSYFRPLIEIISSIGIGLVLYYGGGQVITGKVSLGVLIAFITYVEMFFRPIRELTESYTLLQSAMASSERIFVLLDEKVAILSKKGARKIEKLSGSIEFRNVWFKYDEEWVLKNVSFTVAPGESVAFVGPTGSGKTSIINLLSRLYDIQKGEILIDSINLQNIDIDSLRAQVGVVPQDVFLFAGDIKSNISLSKELDEDRIKNIAAYINADTFIDRFPDKYDQNVAERGVTFSTGERQLLSFARALAFDPRILVLDEATANIDAETEKLIQDGMKKLVEGRTSLIIAHRLSTIKDVDRIFVIYNGEIKEVGSHDELIKRQGLYYHLYKLQSLHQPV
jgi:ATP-binding cassette subfamily B multidrug efflux pump